MAQVTTGEQSVTIDASPDRVYELVSDIRRMGDWSPETTGADWIGGASGPAVGARFKATNKRGMMRWSNKPEVIAADPGKEFAFTRKAGGGEVVWRYRLAPEGSGTKLTESYEVLRPAPAFMTAAVYRLMRIRDRSADLADNMRQTLERIKAAAESGS